MSGKTARHIRSFPPEVERRCARPSTALVDRAAASALDGWVFFDRGLIDAAANLQFMTGEPALATLGQSPRYHRRVFLTPPWARKFIRPTRSGVTAWKKRVRSTGSFSKTIRRWATKSASCQGSGCRNVPTSSSMRWQNRMSPSGFGSQPVRRQPLNQWPLSALCSRWLTT